MRFYLRFLTAVLFPVARWKRIIAGGVRFEKIKNIISSSKYGIHDISRTEPDHKTKLPRFNMPLEPGVFTGASRYGNKAQKQKNCLIMDKKEFRYRKFISDIAIFNRMKINPQKLSK